MIMRDLNILKTLPPHHISIGQMSVSDRVFQVEL